MTGSEYNISLEGINTRLAKRQNKYLVFLLVLVFLLIGGLVSYLSKPNKYVLFGLVIIFLFLITSIRHLARIVKLRKNIKENPEQYKNAQGQYSLSDVDLLLGSWLWF